MTRKQPESRVAIFLFLLAFMAHHPALARTKFKLRQCYHPQALTQFCKEKGFEYYELRGRGLHSCYVVCRTSHDSLIEIVGAMPLTNAMEHELGVLEAPRPSCDLQVEGIRDPIKSELEEILADARKSELVHPNTLETIQGIIKLHEIKDIVAAISDESERNKVITQKVRLTAEPGFCRGKDREVILECIQGKSNLLLNCYQQAKEAGLLEDFFYTGFASDPCFNGRMGALEDYCATRLYGISSDALEDPTKAWQKRVFEYMRLIADIETEAEESKEPLSDNELFKRFKEKVQEQYSDVDVESQLLKTHFQTARDWLDPQ